MNIKKVAINTYKKVDLGNLLKKFGLGDIYENIRNDFPFSDFLDFFGTDTNLGKYAESMAEYQLFPDISKVIEPGSKRVIFMQFLITTFYGSHTFSIKKSKEIIMENVERLSQKYDIIPLVYTTLKLPASTDYPPNIWRDILSADSFKKEDYGQLEFLDAILELRDKKLINISYIATAYADKNSLVIEAGVWKTGKDLSVKNLTQNGEKIDLLGISHEQALFLIKLVFGHIFRILEAVSTGYIYIVDENLNAKYVLLSDNLNGLLKRRDFEELKKELSPDLLPKHLFEPADEMDVWWEHGGQSGMMSFIGDIEAAWVRAGQQTFPLPGWLIQYFNDIDNATIQHRKNKATQWGHITKNIEERKARGEFSFGQPPKQGEEKERVLKLEISKMPELVIKGQEKPTGKQGKQNQEIELYLNNVGDFFRENKDKYCYPMGEGSDRHKIVRFLTTNKGYSQTSTISSELNGKSEQSIRTEIGKINNNFQEFIKPKPRDALLIEGRKGSGYRMNPKYKIIIRNK